MFVEENQLFNVRCCFLLEGVLYLVFSFVYVDLDHSQSLSYVVREVMP